MFKWSKVFEKFLVTGLSSVLPLFAASGSIINSSIGALLVGSLNGALNAWKHREDF